MGAGSIPDSPAMPAGETAEDRERAWAAAHPPVAQGQPVLDSKQQGQQQQYQSNAQQHTYSAAPASGGQALYPQPVAGIPVRGVDSVSLCAAAVANLSCAEAGKADLCCMTGDRKFVADYLCLLGRSSFLSTAWPSDHWLSDI